MYNCMLTKLAQAPASELNQCFESCMNVIEKIAEIIPEKVLETYVSVVTVFILST